MKGFVRISTFLAIFALVLVWIFSGWPRILNFLPEIQEAQAVSQGDGRIIYGESTVNTPRTRTWTGSWEDPESSINAVGTEIRHVIVKAAPTRDEMIVGIQTTGGALYIQRWNGSTWSSEWNVTLGNSNLPRFDVSYEQSSGEALVAYSANSTTNELRYQTWNGSSWSGEQTYDAVRTTGIIDAIAMTARSGTNEIAIAWGDTNMDLSAQYWNGNGWVSGGEPSAVLSTQLETTPDTATALTTWSFDLEFEGTSGELLVAWGNRATSGSLFYVTRTAGAGGSWSSIQSTTLPAEDVDDLDMSADSLSNFIGVSITGADSGNDGEAMIWDGGAWGNFIAYDNGVAATAAGSSGNSSGWLTSGGQTRYIIVYDDATGAGVLDLNIFNKNTPGWLTNQNFAVSPAPVLDGAIQRWRDNPFNNAEAMWIQIDTASDLFAKKISFDGTNVTVTDTEPGGAALELSASSINGFAADFAFNKFIPPVTTLGSGTDPSSQTIAPGVGATDIDAFTFQTSAGTDSITQATTTFSADISAGVSEVQITSDNGSTIYGSSTLSGTAASISLSGLTANTTQTQYKIRVVPKTHVNMPAPPGVEYTATATISAWTGSNTQAGSDSNANALTIDNLSPNGATATSTSAGNAQVTLNWTTSNSSDFSTSTILRWTGASAGSEVPAEGVEYAVNATIGTATVACNRGDAASTAVSGTDGAGTGGCSATPLTNDQAYSYKVFQKDSRGNYDVGVNMGSATPTAPTVSCSASITSTAFGTLSVGSVTSASPNASTTMSCTFSAGCTLSVSDAGNGSNPGLATTTPAYLIPSPDAAFNPTAILVAGTEGYGITATTTAGGSGGTLAIYSRYDVDAGGNRVGGLKLTTTGLASSTAAITNRQLIIKHKAAISNLTNAAKYEDTITYSCTGN